MQLGPSILIANREEGILLVRESQAKDLARIMDETEFPLIIVCPDAIDNADRAIGFIAGWRQGRNAH